MIGVMSCAGSVGTLTETVVFEAEETEVVSAAVADPASVSAVDADVTVLSETG